jgi:ferredoxin
VGRLTAKPGDRGIAGIQGGSMRILLDEEKCVGAGQCVLTLGEVFDQRDEDGIAVLLDERPDETKRGEVETAVQLCPGQAIEVRTD